MKLRVENSTSVRLDNNNIDGYLKKVNLYIWVVCRIQHGCMECSWRGILDKAADKYQLAVRYSTTKT